MHLGEYLGIVLSFNGCIAVVILETVSDHRELRFGVLVRPSCAANIFLAAGVFCIWGVNILK